jgi:hypothetical protein
MSPASVECFPRLEGPLVYLALFLAVASLVFWVYVLFDVIGLVLIYNGRPHPPGRLTSRPDPG